jgi:hypothetical protein
MACGFDGRHSPGVLPPTALEATGSDLHRVCLARLRCVFRLFLPPDAFFLPKPFGLVSCRNARGVSPSEVSPSNRRSSSLDDSSLLGIFVDFWREPEVLVGPDGVFQLCALFRTRFRFPSHAVGTTCLQGFSLPWKSVHPAEGV